MGIKNLNQFLNKNCENYCYNIDLSVFKGHRIAIDADNFIYAFYFVSSKYIIDETNFITSDIDKDKINIIFLDKIWAFIKKFLIKKITPIFIFDGKPPIEKQKVRNKRKEIKENRLLEIQKLKEKLKEFDLNNDISNIINKIKNIYHYIPLFSENEKSLVKTLLQGLGIPYINALGEAEVLCSTLCRNNKVIAVYSTDTDNFVHGCPVVIKKFENNNMVIIILRNILNSLELTFSEFVDFCIMSGCDYNTNINLIGTIKSYNLIKKFKSIDNLPENYDRTNLNYKKCRELFSYKKLEEILPNETQMYDIDFDISKKRDILSTINADKYLKELISLYEDFPKRTIKLKILD
uniref:Flap endonuclease n=1 Tax=Pithovirus LCPAC104 TaxID=2506589 RepID=A0A481Z3Z8_9VIRU|nr:MAG: flap endonuclease [Pithovirus LCPAC104]